MTCAGRCATTWSTSSAGWPASRRPGSWRPAPPAAAGPRSARRYRRSSTRTGGEAIPNAEEALRTRGIQSAWRVEIDAHVGVVVLTRRTGIDRLCAQLAELAGGPVGLSAPYANLEQTPAALRQARLASAAATP